MLFNGKRCSIEFGSHYWAGFHYYIYQTEVGDDPSDDIVEFDLLGFHFRIRLPWSHGYSEQLDEDFRKAYGWEFYDHGNGHIDELYMNWKFKSKFIELPWEWNWYSTTKIDANNNVYKVDYRLPWKERDRIDDEANKKIRAEGGRMQSAYTYILKNGKVQNTIADYYEVIREWRPKCMMWQNLITLKKHEIEIEFKDEIGSRAGSWKGGCVGCSYEMKKGELPIETLRRMEKERKFN